jgi:alkylation response protein AidB-like acyl-CoA dehydrogenase
LVARTAGNPGDEEGITLFAVDAKAQGINLTPVKTIAADKQFQVDFDNVSVSSDEVIGDPGGGLSVIRSVLEKAAAIQCAEAAGGAQQELDMTAKYTKEREQFDRPIGTFQAVQHRLADMYVDARAARWTTYQAVWRLSEGMPASRELAIAKAITSKACQRVAFSAQQLHGGIGVDMDYDLHFYYRRAKAFELKFGTPSFHLEALGAEI